VVILVHQVLDVLVFSSADDGYDRCIDPIPCYCKYDLRMILNDFNISDAHCCFLFAGRSYKSTISMTETCLTSCFLLLSTSPFYVNMSSTLFFGTYSTPCYYLYIHFVLHIRISFASINYQGNYSPSHSSHYHVPIKSLFACRPVMRSYSP
jgi:hypothetical protein